MRIFSLGGALFSSRAESNERPTSLSTESPTVLSWCRHESAGTTVTLMYCCVVLPISKEKRSMEPRQLRLPGFTRFWARAFPAGHPQALASSTGPAADICSRSRS
jgi:hypothetical protein